jgi:hypothetical protein
LNFELNDAVYKNNLKIAMGIDNSVEKTINANQEYMKKFSQKDNVLAS